MMRFAAANLDRSDAPIPRALRRCHEARVGGGPGLASAWGGTSERDDRQVVGTAGSPGGCRLPRTGASCGSRGGGARELGRPAVDLGLYLLDFADAPPEPYDPEELVSRTGSEPTAPRQELRLEVLVEHGQPLARLTGQPARVFPAEPGVLESRGGAVRLVLEAGDRDVPRAWCCTRRGRGSPRARAGGPRVSRVPGRVSAGRGTS